MPGRARLGEGSTVVLTEDDLRGQRAGGGSGIVAADAVGHHEQGAALGQLLLRRDLPGAALRQPAAGLAGGNPVAILVFLALASGVRPVAGLKAQPAAGLLVSWRHPSSPKSSDPAPQPHWRSCARPRRWLA